MSRAGPRKILAVASRGRAWGQLRLRVPGWVLDSRVRARMAALGVDAAGDYVARVSDERELDMLVELLRVGETRFFRHSGAMTALADTVVFGDDFEDGNSNGWSKSGGSWSVLTDGSRVLQQTSATAGAMLIAIVHA